MPKKPSPKAVVVARNSNSLFKSPKNDIKDHSCTQTVNVQVNIEKREDGLTGCFKALIGMFRKGG